MVNMSETEGQRAVPHKLGNTILVCESMIYDVHTTMKLPSHNFVTFKTSIFIDFCVCATNLKKNFTHS